MVRRPARSRRSSSRKRILRSEPLERRELLSGNGLLPWTAGYGLLQSAGMVGATAAAAPQVAQAISVSNGAVLNKSDWLSVLGSDPAGESKLVYKWTVTSSPAGGVATFSSNGANASKNTMVTFNEVGSYSFTVTILDSTTGLSVSSVKTVAVTAVMSGLRLVAPSGQVVTYPAVLNVTGTSQAIVAQGLDQFGAVMAAQPAFVWSTMPLTANTPATNITTSGNMANVGFTKIGLYALTARVSNNSYMSAMAELNVVQTLTSVRVTPNTASLCQGAAQQFAASGYDQFQNAMATQPTFAWSASGGSITAAGMFTAPSVVGSDTITAKIGSVAGTAVVQVTSGALQDSALASLVSSLDADGSISRLDMIKILQTVDAKGALSAVDFSDLKKIVNEAAVLDMPSYVQVLASDVINGNVANATFQGAPMGNLAVGSSAAQLTNLINKWFFGADLPALCDKTLVYKSTAGSLFPHTPSHTDEYQGEMGDCYLITALGTLADSNPAAIENMIINNGDGTYTVRFYTGPYGTIYNYSDGSISAGFSNNAGVADYVTVNSMLPVNSQGKLAMADAGASYTNAANALWIPLIEKAYAQWDQTGNEGAPRTGVNAYQDIQGGWMATVDAQVLGHNGTDYFLTGATATSEQTAIKALAAKEAVTIGTSSFSGTPCGLYANHAYAIIGYTASTDTFTLYNPWGFDQPSQVKWSQLQQYCTQLCVCNTSGSIAISGAPGSATSIKTSSSVGGWSAAAAEPHSAAVAWTFAQSDGAPAVVSSAASRARSEVFRGLANSSEASLHQPHHAARASTVLSPSLIDAALQSLPVLV